MFGNSFRCEHTNSLTHVHTCSHDNPPQTQIWLSCASPQQGSDIPEAWLCFWLGYVLELKDASWQQLRPNCFQIDLVHCGRIVVLAVGHWSPPTWCWKQLIHKSFLRCWPGPTDSKATATETLCLAQGWPEVQVARSIKTTWVKTLFLREKTVKKLHRNLSSHQHHTARTLRKKG